MQTRPNLMQLRDRQHFDIGKLAFEANTSPLLVHVMLLGQPVSEAEADAVLAALSKMHETRYSRETVTVPIIHSEETEEPPWHQTQT